MTFLTGTSAIRPVFSLGRNGRLQHAPDEDLPRHRHQPSFIAVVLRGAYIEAGDSGFARLEAGDVAIHGPCEAHINRTGARGAEVLLLPSTSADGRNGRVRDVDEIVRLAERDAHAASQYVERSLTTRAASPPDWPQLLALELIDQPNLGLECWAEQHRLRPETVSRGFRQVFGCAPKAYRASVRAHRAWRDLKESDRPLKDIAAEWGFADQGHMSRDIAQLTGRPPRAWRKTGQTPFHQPTA